MSKEKRMLRLGGLVFVAAAVSFMLPLSAHAVLVAEAHACNADSDTGDWIAGNFYFPGARSARTYLYEYTAETMDLQVMLWAYPEGGTTYTYLTNVSNVPAGGWYGNAAAVHSEPETARGSLLSYHIAWTPTITRGQTGFYISSSAPVDANGCANKVSYL